MTKRRRNKNKFVFFAAETFPSSVGSGLNAYRFANFLANYPTNEVTIVCYNYNNKLLRKENIEKLQIQRITYFNVNIVLKVLSFPVLVFNYFKFVLKNNVVFVFGRYLVGFEIIILVSQVFKRKIVFQSTLKNDDDISALLNTRNKLLSKLRKSLLQKINCYHSINPDFTRQWLETYSLNNKVIEISQGVNCEDFQPIESTQKKALRKKLKIPEDKLIILSVGILIERKGYRKIIDQLTNLNVPFIYIVAGQYELEKHHRSSKSELNEMAELHQYGKSKLGNNILFLGYQSEIIQYYQVADVFIHGGYKEGTPGVLLEAMACELPVICYSYAGADFLLKHKKNSLVFNNYSEINSYILSIYQKPNDYISIRKTARKDILKNHCFQILNDQIIKQLV